MTIETYHVGSGETEAYRALKATIPQEDRYMHYRLEGNVAEASDDYYFVAHENGVALSRLWMSVPKNDHPIANWGAFFTLEEYRSRGIGGRVLDHCFETIPALPRRPLGLFCTAGKVGLAGLYARYGFTTAIHDTDCGPLYCPMGDSPAAFREFCNTYYTPAKSLRTEKATFRHRNEVDCLLKFALLDRGLDYRIDGEGDLNMILLNTPERDARVILTETGKCVGWMLDGKVCLHPDYKIL